MLWIVGLVIGVACWALLDLVLPLPRSHWRSRLGRWLQGVAFRMTHRGASLPDPFEVLRVQSRLGSLASQIRELEAQPLVYAKMHRLRALTAAYDDLLAEGCRLAGVSVEDGPDPVDVRRWREEQELASRGWSW